MTNVIRFVQTGEYEQFVVGESSYQNNLGQVQKAEGKFVTVNLALEDTNRFDSNAVRVAYGNETLGYLSREDAITYRRSLEALGHPHALGVCRAKIVGGEGKHYGIILDLDIQNPEVEPAVETKPSEQISQPAIIHPQKKPIKLPLWVLILSSIPAIFCLGFSFITMLGAIVSPAAPPAAPTYDPVSIQSTALAQAWLPYTQTAAAVPSNTATLTNTPLPTATFTPTLSPDLLTANAQATRSAEIARYQPIDVRELITYPNNHIGELITISGRVFNINSDTELQIMVGDTFDAVYIVSRDPFTGIYEDDTITVYGLVFGENCGENAFGAQVCQPLLMDALLIK